MKSFRSAIKAPKKSVRSGMFIALFVLFASGGAMATEEIAHTVVRKDGQIEIREYQDTVSAEITVSGPRDEAGNQAFMPLFNFIQGENTAKQTIPMTTPVSQAQSTSQQIPMTTPVSQTETKDGQWVVAFYMPNDMKFENTPTPTDERIKIKKIPGKSMAAIRFSGTSRDSNIQPHEMKLREYLMQNKIDFIDKPIYAFYNSPFVPWFLRRNEILFEIKQ